MKTRILSSLRNQPAELRVKSSTKPLSPEAEEAAWSHLEKNQFKVLSPAQVADIVFTAIREERFYILTHPEFNEVVRKRMEAIIQGQNPEIKPLSLKRDQTQAQH